MCQTPSGIRGKFLPITLWWGRMKGRITRRGSQELTALYLGKDRIARTRSWACDGRAQTYAQPENRLLANS